MINLLINYYNSDNIERQDEIDFCLIENYNNKFIDKIHIFGNINNIVDEKIVIIPKDRPTFKDYFEYINDNILIDDIVIISNTDIYFNDSIQNVNNINLDNTMLALTRFEFDKNNISFLHGQHEKSQDTWVLKKNTIFNNNLLEKINFNLGILGCDNKFAYELSNTFKYNILNIPYIINTFHKHKTNYRTYSNYWIPGPYLFVPAKNQEIT